MEVDAISDMSEQTQTLPHGKLLAHEINAKI
jgi:hypothetical protein